MRAAIFDLDGTLFDCRHRLHHVLPGAKRDWQEFFAGIKDDLIVEPIRDLAVALAASGIRIICCSGRPEEYRAISEQMLDEAGVPFAGLYMRATGDTRPDHVIKMQLLAGIREDGFDPFIVIDDRQSVVDAWREAGLVCLQAAPSETPIPATAKLHIMVGPSGAGKSTWLQWNAHPQHVISSDQIRQDLCGDFRDQSRNVEVFEAMHALAKTRLKYGLPVYLDATHIRRKDRVTAANLVPAYCEVTYVVVDRPLNTKMSTAGWRTDVKMQDGTPLLERHQQTFDAQIREILAGDRLGNVRVLDVRSDAALARAA